MLFYIFIAGICLTAVSGQDCDWINKLDCSTYDSKPLCGSNFVTYDNRCVFAKLHCQAPNVNILSETTCTAAGFTQKTTTGRPTPPQITAAPVTTIRPATTVPTQKITTAMALPTTTHKPVFLGHNLIFDFFCLELSHEQCPDDTEPVCGSDGNLYPNFCEFEKHRCSHQDLTVDHFNVC